MKFFYVTERISNRSGDQLGVKAKARSKLLALSTLLGVQQGLLKKVTRKTTDQP
jgi:hypothetical protein